MLQLMTAAPPAGGAETMQVIGVTAAAALLTTALLFYGMGHRTGRSRLLGRAAGFCERITGEPGWAVLPAALATVSLGIAGLGLYWDVSLHIAQGRDAGPLANPSHYLILAGLFGIFSAGWAAIVLPEGRPGPAAVRITNDWYAPVGGIMLAAAASFALIGFPLDDMWHRLFGQDVTLWGPTHLMLIGGGVLTIPAIVALLAEGRIARRADRVARRAAGATVPRPARTLTLRRRALQLVIALSAGGGLLAGASAFQLEFDYGIPQYHLLFHPLTLAVAAGFALVASRIMVGPGGAVLAVGCFFVFRGALALIVGPVLGEALGGVPLYVGSAIAVELAAMAVVRPGAGPYRLALVAGPLVGIVGALSEHVWSQVAFPIAWPAHMLPETLAISVVGATGAAVAGAFLGGALRPGSGVADIRRPWLPPALGVLAMAAAVGVLLPVGEPPRTTARIDLEPVASSTGRTAHVTVRLSRPDVADDARWVQGLAWQGGEHRLVTAPMRKLAPGVLRTTEPLPLHGSWKALVRIGKGDARMALPVYLPDDPAIPVAGVPAQDGVTRAFGDELRLLQRERKGDIAGWLWPAASAVIGAFVSAFIALAIWALLRIARASPPAPTRGPRPTGRPPRRSRPGEHDREPEPLAA